MKFQSCVVCEVFLPLDEASNDSNSSGDETMEKCMMTVYSVVKASAKMIYLMSI